jgi:hypothetical protein
MTKEKEKDGHQEVTLPMSRKPQEVEVMSQAYILYCPLNNRPRESENHPGHDGERRNFDLIERESSSV